MMRNAILNWLSNRREQKLQRAMESDYRSRIYDEDISGDGLFIAFYHHDNQALEVTRKKFNRPDFVPNGWTPSKGN